MELFICIKINLALNTLQRLICHKTPKNKQTVKLRMVNTSIHGILLISDLDLMWLFLFLLLIKFLIVFEDIMNVLIPRLFRLFSHPLNTLRFFISMHFYDRAIDIMVRVFTNVPRDQGSIPVRVILKAQKIVLDVFLFKPSAL